MLAGIGDKKASQYSNEKESDGFEEDSEYKSNNYNISGSNLSMLSNSNAAERQIFS